MKKIKLSFIVALAIAGASLSAFTGTNTINPGWYGQKDDDASYQIDFPIPATQLNAKCPSSSEHLCAVQLDANGNLVATRRSMNNYQ